MKDQDHCIEAETKRRIEGALSRARTTPHKPNKKFKGKNAATGLRERKTNKRANP